MNSSATSSLSQDHTQSTELMGKLDSLFNDLQGILVPDAKTSSVKSGPSQQATINESGDLVNTVEYLSQKDGLKNELNVIQQREETRLNQVREQNALISRRKEIIAGSDGSRRILDDVGQVQIQKKTGPISSPHEDDETAEEELLLFNVETHEIIEGASKSSPDFNEAFLGSSHSSKFEQEDQPLFNHIIPQQNPLPNKSSVPFEKDEIFEHENTPDIEPQFASHLDKSLNKRSHDVPISNHEIERRIERIGRVINRPVVGKAFAIPTTKSVQRLRSKFGKM